MRIPKKIWMVIQAVFFIALFSPLISSAHTVAEDDPLLHVDPLPPIQSLSAPRFSASALPQASSPLSAVPVLHSLPSATAKVFLEFRGVGPEQWGSHSVPTTPAYDTDGDATTFSATELSNITQIWSRVAEKYALFNVDVTTQDPGYSTTTDSVNKNKYQRIIIGGNGSWFGGGGGVCYVGSFSDSLGTLPNTCYVFSSALGGDPHYIGEAASHETGHSFGLQHQSSYDANGNQTAVYNQGDANRAPIMGNSYYAARGLWWYGNSELYYGKIQDDVDTINIVNTFGFRTDEAGATPGTAASLSLASGTTISGTGYIGTSTDADYYSFSAGAGSASFIASATSSGPTLDLSLELHNSSDVTIATASTTSFGETLNTTIPSTGTYYLVVKSAGRYGDMGQYTLSGSVPNAIADVTPPVISSIATSSVGSTQITVTWITNEGATSQINYGLTSTYTASTTLDTTQVTSHSVLFSGLTPNTTYHYRVRSADASGNLSVSSDQTFTTLSDTTAPVSVISATPTSGISPLAVSFDGSGSSDNVSLQRLVWDFGDSSATSSATSTTHTYLTAGTYTASLTVYDGADNSHTSTKSIVVSPSYTLQILSTNGTVSKNPDQTNYAPATSVVLTATPSAGYSFTGWTGNASGSTSPLTITMDADKYITALFLPNLAPLVDAGIDQNITLPATATLTGSTTDDNLPYVTLTTTWTKTSGSGTVTFGNANATSTTAIFSAAGTYVLTLSAADGAATTTDTVTITVAAAPVVSSGGGGGGGGVSIPYVSTTWNISTSTGSTTSTILTSTTFSDTTQYTYVSLLSRTLSYGVTSSEVLKLQHFLASQGNSIYPGTLFTTYYGTLTKAAVIRFQKANSLSQTGTVDAKTLALINTISGPQKVAVVATLTSSNTGGILKAVDVKTGSTHANVKILQQFLNRNGYTVAATGYGSPGNETTYFGPATTRAVMKFQRAYNIKPVAGYVGPLTRAKINALISEGK